METYEIAWFNPNYLILANWVVILLVFTIFHEFLFFYHFSRPTPQLVIFPHFYLSIITFFKFAYFCIYRLNTKFHDLAIQYKILYYNIVHCEH